MLANNALRTSLSAYTAATAVASAAKTTFDAALAAYRSGVGSITDATMAETQLLQARNASTDAYSTALSCSRGTCLGHRLARSASSVRLLPSAKKHLPPVSEGHRNRLKIRPVTCGRIHAAIAA